jgi:hypothetical protein
MPLGHNRHDPEFGKVVPDGRQTETAESNGGLGSAILLSLGLHALIALWFWHGLVSGGNENPDASRVIDTRVRNPGIEVEVCLRLLEPSKLSAKKEISHPISPPIQSLPAKDLAESLKPSSRVAGADSQMLTGASKTQPRPPESTINTPFVNRGGSPDGSWKSIGAGGGGTTFFHLGTRARSVVYVIDRSVSMGPNGGLLRAKQELLTSLRSMPAQTLFQIIIFNRSVEMLPLGPSLLPATNENKRKAAEFLASVQPEGGTLPLPALKRALALKPEVVFFLSDGGDWTDQQVQEVTSLNRGHTVIHVVDFGGPGRDQLNGPLRFLASKNHGAYRSVSMGRKETWPISGN